MSVTVILSGYKRPYTLQSQYDAILRQTFRPQSIMLWINIVEDLNKFPQEVVNNCESIVSNGNYGVWGRFSLALNARTDHICIIDDDTIPGDRWLENCVNTINEKDGILSTRGVIADKQHDRMYPAPQSYKAVGWCNPNEETTRVDMGCHSWFFAKPILRAFWAEMPLNVPMNYGEDMHLSYVAQKHFGLFTYIPKHPIDDKSLWGSMPDTASQYGEDKNAISWSGEANMGMNKYWNFIRNNGYKIIAEESEEGK
jgi:hypothetical protein